MAVLFLPLIVGFLITLFVIPYWIKKAKKIGLIWEDMNKVGHPKNVIGSGGIAVLLGFIAGTLIYVAIKTFIYKLDVTTVEIFALLTTVLIAGIIGLVDDLLGWVHGGLSARLRIFLLIFASLPLIVINAGESVMMGINFGLLYPLFFIPLGIVGATATFNILAGYNGLEASQGILVLGALSVATFLSKNSWLSLICLIMILCLAAFLVYNKYPARIFPGDVLTYSVGALIAIIAILGNIEKIAVFFFIPYILETILKIRGKLKMHSFGKVNEKGDLDMPYEKFYGVEHIAIYLLKKYRGRATEKEVVLLINLFQIIVIILGFILFGSALSK